MYTRSCLREFHLRNRYKQDEFRNGFSLKQRNDKQGDWVSDLVFFALKEDTSMLGSYDATHEKTKQHRKQQEQKQQQRRNKSSLKKKRQCLKYSSYKVEI